MSGRLSQLSFATNTPSDPYFSNTILLLTGDNVGVTSTNNNVFVDSSANNNLITRTGNVTQGSFNPFSLENGRWSVFFDGTDDAIQRDNNAVTNPLFSFGTGDFTVEAWIYKTSQIETSIVDARTGNTATPWAFYISGSNFPYFYDGTARNSNTAISLFKWEHIAATRQSGTLRIFVNGNLGFSNTVTTNLDRATGIRVGIGVTGLSDYAGYLSNVHVVKGQALYTENFVPSMRPVKPVSNTTFLVCHSNRIENGANTDMLLSTSNQAKVSAFSPFIKSRTREYSRNAHSTEIQSGYFDSTGDYLTVANNALQITTGPFTLEGWVWVESLNVARYICENAKWNFGNNGGYRIYLGVDRRFQVQGSEGVFNTFPVIITGGPNDQVNVRGWNHFAFVRNSNNEMQIYTNGKTSANRVIRSDSLNLTNGGSGTITSRVGGIIQDGNFANGWDGYIADLRLVIGTCLYNTSFTPPTKRLTAVPGTQFLLNFNNAAIVDSTENNGDIETRGDAQIDTTIKKFGKSSIRFDGTGDALVIKPSNASSSGYDFIYGTGEFTIECWIYLNSTGTYGIFGHGAGSGASPYFYINTDVPTLFFNNTNVCTGPSVSTSTWTHLAVTRSGTTLRVFTDGISGTPVTDSTNFILSAPMTVGASQTIAQVLNGYIDDLRITKGVARYISDFTPPRRAHPRK